MAFNIQYTDGDDNQGNGSLETYPDHCPSCHNKVTPIRNTVFRDGAKLHQSDEIQAVFRCTNSKCRDIFIGYYRSAYGNPSHFNLVRTAPEKPIDVAFSNIIRQKSPNFSNIYNEAHATEQHGLVEVCGPGYRKALEFLIKDYVMSGVQAEAEKEEIKSEFLGATIQNRIKDEKIRAVAKRAVWLGNDETHYMRKWIGQDLQDLKKLIELTVHWMEAEVLTKEFLDNMPEPTITA